MPTAERIIVVGAAGFGRESLDVVQAMEANGTPIDLVGVIDDAPSDENLQRLIARDIPYLGTVDEWLCGDISKARFVIGIGNPSIRKQIAEKLESAGLIPYTAIHPSATIGSQSHVEAGVVVCAGVVISSNVKLGRYVHVNPNATIGHDAILNDFVSINPSAVISGEVNIREGVLVGAAALVLQNLKVGEGTIVGAAALVTKNVPRNVVVKGVPGSWEA